MKKTTLCIMVLLLIGSLGYGQGKIERAEERLKKENEGNPVHETERSNGSSSAESDFLVETIGLMVVDAFLYASYYALVESPFEREYRGSKSFINKSPYWNSYKGNYSY